MTKTMTWSATIKALKKYFNIQELVCKHTHERFGDEAWRFLDTDLLRVLLVLRKGILKVPLIVNTGNVNQRGLRCNMCALVKSKNKNYLSAHILGKGIDAVSPEMTAAHMRSLIVQNKDLLPCPIRVEAGVTWLHFDVIPTDSEQKVTFFEA